MVAALIWIAVALLIFVRQFQPQPLRRRALLLLGPAVLGFVGLQGLAHLTTLEADAFFALNAAVAVAFGVWRGTTFRVWKQNARGRSGPWCSGLYRSPCGSR